VRRVRWTQRRYTGNMSISGMKHDATRKGED
jgi:hypothetical protein